jgi:hypothetical protein
MAGRGEVRIAAVAVALSAAFGAAPAGALDLPIARCDPIDPAVCLQPWPNDYFTVDETPNEPGGRHLNLDILAMPRNVEGKPIDPSEWNRNDGFSPGSEIVTKVPGLDNQQAFERTGAVPIDDMARAFEPDQPIVLINVRTRARHLIWAEIDANPSDPADRNLIIRPGRNLAEGTRYIVALRRLRDKDGNLLEPTGAFKAIRDKAPTTNAVVETRRTHFEEKIFPQLAAAGIPRADLYRAWDFTVASEKNLSERMLFIRNDALAKLGDTTTADLIVQGRAPAFQITRVQENVDEFIARRVQGTYTVPCYLNLPNCPSGSRFVYPPGSRDGPPMAIPGNTMTARFTCNIPHVAMSGPAARPSLYGHGLFGSRSEVNQGQLRRMAQEHNFVFCATDWIGMSCADLPDDPAAAIAEAQEGRLPNVPNCDIPITAFIEHDLSNFPMLADRVQQGMLNFIYLGRLMLNAGGFNANPAFQAAGGRGVIDTTRLFYDGNSQGGIIGGALIAVQPDLTRGVLGVPGMNYSTLLQRSIDFGTGKAPEPNPDDLPDSLIPEYAYLLYVSYPRQIERQLIFSLMQQLWDRAEANGYARHMTDDPLPGTPPHQVLMHVGLGDHQVSQYAAEVEARTIGARARVPWADPGRDTDVDPIFQIPSINRFPYFGSAIVLWDIGPPRLQDGRQRGTLPPPKTNTPPASGEDPHEAPRNEASARLQKSEFLKVGGRVIDVCGLGPCYAGGWAGP